MKTGCTHVCAVASNTHDLAAALVVHAQPVVGRLRVGRGIEEVVRAVGVARVGRVEVEEQVCASRPCRSRPAGSPRRTRARVLKKVENGAPSLSAHHKTLLEPCVPVRCARVCPTPTQHQASTQRSARIRVGHLPPRVSRHDALDTLQMCTHPVGCSSAKTQDSRSQLLGQVAQHGVNPRLHACATAHCERQPSEAHSHD